MGYKGSSKGYHGASKAKRQCAFKAGRKAALREGWKAFTPMNKTQHSAFVEAYHDAL